MQIVQRNIRIFDDDFDLIDANSDSSNEEQPPEYQIIGGLKTKID